MAIQTFLQTKITWLTMPGLIIERAFNNRYARVSKQVLQMRNKKRDKMLTVNGQELHPFYETREYVYYATPQSIEDHKKAGDL